MYYFADNKLVRGAYIFRNEHINNNQYIDDFETVKKSLTEKYGKPQKDEQVWSGGDLFKNDPSVWGTAVAVGNLQYGAVWTLNDTQIALWLSGDNLKIQHVLGYKSTKPEHLELMKKAQDKAKSGIW